MRLVAALGVLTGLLVSGVAQAATVHVGSPPPPHYAPPFDYNPNTALAVFYDAAPGETNHLVVSSARDPSTLAQYIDVHDGSARVSPGSGCTAVDAHTAHCSDPADLSFVFAQLGDGNDTLHMAPASVLQPDLIVNGGPGNDTLVGGRSHDELAGGGGRDVLRGGAGFDVVTDGDRSHAAGSAGPGPDTLDGGSGYDLISYEQRAAGVNVDLRTRRAGEPGERDTIRNFEDVLGGRGADHLTGSNGDNSITGGPGNDVLNGLAGNDQIFGGPGRDHLNGGPGDDFLSPRGGRDSVSCGPGFDTFTWPQAGEFVGSHCEQLYFDRLGHGNPLNYLAMRAHPVATHKRVVNFRIPCPVYAADDGDSLPCAGSLTLRTADVHHRLIGRVTIPDRRGTRTIRVHLTSRGTRLVSRRSGVIARVSLRGAHSAGHPLPNADWKLRLKA